MAKITLKGNSIHTCGELPTLGEKPPQFRLVDKDLKDRKLDEFIGKKLLIATVPSLDTGVCSQMTRHFNEFAKKHPEITFLTISTDLPFAQGRFCEKEGVQNVITLSMMRDKEFGKTYGVLIVDGPLEGILARSILVVNEQGKVIYRELVPEIAEEPNYAKALESLQIS